LVHWKSNTCASPSRTWRSVNIGRLVFMANPCIPVGKCCGSTAFVTKPCFSAGKS